MDNQESLNSVTITTKIPSLFQPVKLTNDIILKNHIAISSMCSFAATPKHEIANLHFSRYKSFALQKPGLIMFEGIFISENGLTDEKELGIWNDEQAFKIKELIQEIHDLNSICCVQLFHSGRKAKGNDIVAPSPIPYDSNSVTPKELSINDIQEIRKQYLEAAKRSINICGFDAIEIACCNGNLLHQFQSKITNERHDEYGYKSPNSRIKLLYKQISILNITSGKISPNSKPRYQLSENSNIPAHLPFNEFLKKKFSHSNCLIGCSGALDMNIPKLNEYIENEILDIAFIGESFLENPDLIEYIASKLNYSTKEK